MTRRYGLAALGIAIYLAIPYRWALATRDSDLHSAARARAAARVVDLQVAHARLVRRDRAAWAQRLQVVRAAFPPTVDVSDQMATLDAAASSASTRIVSVTTDPALTSPASGPVAVHVHLQLEGTPPAVEAFLAHLRASPRLWTVTHVVLTTTTADVTADVWTM